MEPVFFAGFAAGVVVALIAVAAVLAEAGSVTADQYQVTPEGDLEHASRRVIDMQARKSGRSDFRGPQAYRNAEGADFPQGAA